MLPKFYQECITKRKMPKPKDLGIKIGSKEEVYWKEIKEAFNAQVENVEKELKLKKAVAQMAALNEKREHDLFNRTPSMVK